MKKLGSIKRGVMYIVGVCIIAAMVILGPKSTYDKRYSQKVTLDTASGMTAEQRSEDFAELCAYLEAYIPTLYEYEELYGISYADTKEYYRDLAESSESDFEYYMAVYGFLENIPSGHAAAGFPLLSRISKIDYAFSEQLEKNKSFVSAQNYWYETIHEECKKHYDEEITEAAFAYYEGEYRGIAEPPDNDVFGINRAVLLSVNGTSPDEYIKLYPSVYKLSYDHTMQKPFREALVFNDTFGEKCTIEFLDEAGEKRSLELYCGIQSYFTTTYAEYFKEVDGISSPQPESSAAPDEGSGYITVGDMTITRSEERNLLYLRISSFNTTQPYGKQYADAIKSASEGIDNILVDLRHNGGGYYYDALAVLGAISDRDITAESAVYITEESYNRSRNKKKYEYDEAAGLYKTIETYEIEGTASEKKNLYLLISERTGSSADDLVYEFKRNGLGTVIGTNNTGGERSGTICLNYCGISGIYYTYTEYAAADPDGKFSSVYGTPPDVYVSQPIEAYFIRDEIMQSGEDHLTLENHLKWDKALCEAIEIIEG